MFGLICVSFIIDFHFLLSRLSAVGDGVPDLSELELVGYCVFKDVYVNNYAL